MSQRTVAAMNAAMRSLSSQARSFVESEGSTPAFNKLSSKERAALSRAPGEALGAGNIATAKSVFRIMSGVLEPTSPEWTRFADSLRPSRHRTRLRALEEILRTSSNNSCTDHARKRVESWANYTRLYRFAQDELLHEKRRLRRTKGWAFWCFVIAERAFVNRTPFDHDPRASADGIAETVSFVFGVMTADGRSLDFGDLGTSVDIAEPPSQLLTRLAAFANIRMVIELEPLVFRLEHRCEKSPGKPFGILPPTESIGRAAVYGPIRTEFQHSKLLDDSADAAVSFRDVCEQIFQRYSDSMLTVTADHRPRIRWTLDESLCATLGEILFGGEWLFAEERELLLREQYEQSAPWDKLLGLEVRSGLTLFDIIRMQRIYQMAAHLRWRFVEAAELDARVVAHSAVSGLRTAELHRVLCLFGFAEAKARAFLELFSWHEASGARLDLQYTPLVQLRSGWTIMPLALLAASNSVRNTQVLAKIRHDHGGHEDLLGERFAHACKVAGVNFARHINYSDGAAIAGELDFAFVVDAVLVVLETKNTLLPATPHETQTLWDHIVTGTRQLRRARTVLDNALGRERFERALANGGLVLPAEYETAFCVVTSSRTFAGCSINGFPVRDVFELVSVIAGEPATVNTPEGQLQLAWHVGAVTGKRLKQYLSDEDPVWSCIHRAMQPSELRLRLGNRVVALRQYGYDQLSCLEYLADADLVDRETVQRLKNAALVAASDGLS